MRRFATIATADTPFKIALWQEQPDGSCKPIRHVLDFGDLDPSVDVWRFDVETSVDVRTAVNAGRHPVLDADGGPLWTGCAIEFVLPASLRLERRSGTLVKVDGYGYAQLACQGPNSYRDIILCKAKFHHEGPMRGAIILEGGAGCRRERDELPVFLRRTSDPRLVCQLLEPGASLSL